MKITGSYRFEAPREAVWSALQDPTVLTRVLPGCEKLDEVGEHEYTGTLNMKVGPVQGVFKGHIQMLDIEPQSGFRLAIDGRGAPGFVKASAKVALRDEEGGTVVDYDSDAQVGGRIAGVGQRLLDSSGRSIVQQSLDGFHELIKARVAESGPVSDTSDVAAVGYQAPTQAEFATKVARDVARDLIPRPVLVGALILIVLAVLYFVLR